MKKPIHKHIGHHAKRIHRNVTKYLYERDTLFATLWVFIFIIALAQIPLNLGIMNPIKLGLKDFDFNDISYSKLEKAKYTEIDSNIVIVNIEQADREGLAMMIDKVGTMGPKVMALDVTFDGPKEPQQDSLIAEVFKKNKNLIAATKLELSGKNGDTISLTGNYINTASTYAYVNLFSDSISTIRYFEPFLEDYKDTTYISFAAAIVQAYDTNAYNRLKVKGHHHKVLINYSRRLNQYLVVKYEDILLDKVDDSAFYGKIVLFGYISENRYDIEDKKFTPMNERFAGKSIPDMNGIVVHANIISMALENSYIKKLPSWATWLIAIFVCWLHMSFFIRYYLESHIWFHLVAKLAQVASAIFFVWLGIYLFDRFRLKVDIKMSLIVIVMAVDVIYFYEAWAVWMHKKFGFKTVFKPHHH